MFEILEHESYTLKEFVKFELLEEKGNYDSVLTFSIRLDFIIALRAFV